MTSIFSATPPTTPPAGLPPVIAGSPPAGQDHADRWDWLRTGAFFCVAVFLLSLIVATLNGWYYEAAHTNLYLELHQTQMSQIFFIADLALPATLLIAGSALWDHTFWGASVLERAWGVGRLALALGVVAIVAGLAIAFGTGIDRALPYPGLVPLTSGYGLGANWMVSGIENGLILGVALAFVFRRLSLRTGRGWIVGLLGAALLAAGILALYSHNTVAARLWIGTWMQTAQMWLVMSVLPIGVALLLGALIGAPLAYPYGAREVRATAAMGEEVGLPSQLQRVRGGRGFWRALGIGAGSFAAGLFIIGTRLYAIVQLTGASGSKAQTLFVTLIIVQLVPFGVLALVGGIRLVRLPREWRPSAWGVSVLALVAVLGLLPTLVPQLFLIPLMAAVMPSAQLALGDTSFAFAASLGALLALCWWPATASSLRRTLAVTVAGWLGFALPILLVAGLASYGLAISSSSQAACHGLGCGLGAALLFLVIQMGVISIILGLPLVLLGIWMGSWLLQRGSERRAGGAAV